METHNRSGTQSDILSLSSFSLDKTSLTGLCSSFMLDVERQSRTQQTVQTVTVDNQIQCMLLADGNIKPIDSDEIVQRLAKHKISPSRVMKALKWYLHNYCRGIFISQGIQADIHVKEYNLGTTNTLALNDDEKNLNTVYSPSPEGYTLNAKPLASPRRRNKSLSTTTTNVISVGYNTEDATARSSVNNSKQRFKSCIPLAINTSSKKSELPIKRGPSCDLPVRTGSNLRKVNAICTDTEMNVYKKVDFTSQIDLKPKYLITQSTETDNEVEKSSQTVVPASKGSNKKSKRIIHNAYNDGSTLWIAIKQSSLNNRFNSSKRTLRRVDEKTNEAETDMPLGFSSSAETVVCNYNKMRSVSKNGKRYSKAEMNPWNFSRTLIDRIKHHTLPQKVYRDDEIDVSNSYENLSSNLLYYVLDKCQKRKSLGLIQDAERQSKQKKSKSSMMPNVTKARTRRIPFSDSALFGIAHKERAPTATKGGASGEMPILRKTSKRTALEPKVALETMLEEHPSCFTDQLGKRKKVEILYKSSSATSSTQLQKWEKSIVQTEKTLYHLRKKISHLNQILKRGVKEEMVGIHYFNSSKRCSRNSTSPNVTRSMPAQCTCSRMYQKHAAEKGAECHNPHRCQGMKNPASNFPHVPSVPLHLLVPRGVI